MSEQDKNIVNQVYANLGKALEAFLAHARFFDPPLEVVHIPFEGKEIVGYLRLPKNATAQVPLVIAVNGLDSRKEDLTEIFSAILPFGVAYLAVDVAVDPVQYLGTRGLVGLAAAHRPSSPLAEASARAIPRSAA